MNSPLQAMIQAGASMVGNNGGGGDEPKPLSPQEMKDWNKFIKFVKSKGMSGSKELDKRDTDRGKALFDEYKALNPDTSINYDIVPRAQAEFLRFQKFHQGFKERKGEKIDDQFNSLSPQDGWFGSLTSQQELIPLVEQTVDGGSGQVLSKVNKGLMSGFGIPTGGQQSNMIMRDGKPVTADGREAIQLKDGWYVEDDDGNLVTVEMWNKIKSKR